MQDEQRPYIINKVSLKNPEPHKNSEAFTTWLSSFLVKWYWKATRNSAKNLVHPFQKKHMVRALVTTSFHCSESETGVELVLNDTSSNTFHQYLGIFLRLLATTIAPLLPALEILWVHRVPKKLTRISITISVRVLLGDIPSHHES
jgi:hypothetical protein